jgi:cytoskeletal protein RodZ
MNEIKNNKSYENEDAKKNKSFFEIITKQKNLIKERLITGFKKYYKYIILITITVLLIFLVYMIKPLNNNSKLIKSVGGAPASASPAPASASPASPSTASPSTASPAKSSTPGKISAKTTSPVKSAPSGQIKTSVTTTSCLSGPFDNAISNMYKVFDNIFFIYLLLIMIIVVPSMPIFLYMFAVYFVITRLFNYVKQI